MRRRGGAVPGRRVIAAVALAVLAACAGGCGAGGEPPPEVPDGSPAKGRLLLSRYGCTSCHTVPGVEGDALVGPPLTSFGRRGYIAGELPNSGPNLQRWIRNPPAIEPGTAMPNLGVTEQDARDIAAYLFTLD
ncbi:c-type cytochrome [Microtetraspora fusca]|uniref:c-type cytochrome n=1 Tax=Microtetraspora fusca TaxID=1997 RepID=UPI00082DC645|nr:c-type cytochrome [Microtetraspora fusca]